MPGNRADVLFYVQHLLGVGHLHRACVLARAMARAGLRVVFVSGGMPVPGTDAGDCSFVQLSPLRSRDESFSALVDAEGRELDARGEAERRERLLGLLRHYRPRTLMFEMFPFGRRQMRFELLPLLEAAKASEYAPAIVCSLRDILTTHKKPGKTEWILETLETYFDLVLVHGDPAFVPLERSFPDTGSFRHKLRYTGYVVEPAAGIGDGERRRDGEVVVSAGGGAVAAPLIDAAIAARPLTSLASVPWRLLAGQNLPERSFAALRERCVGDTVLERARPDFPALLSRAPLSISQAGYNTALEVLAAGVPAVLVPFSASRQTEQSLRARLLAERGAVTVVPENRLSARNLAAGIERALARTGDFTTPTQEGGPGFIRRLDVGGAERTAALIRECVASGVRPVS